MQQILRNAARDLLVYLVLTAATFLMLRTIAEHSTFRPDAGFLQFKQEHINNWVWRSAFYIHVFSAVLTLLAGFTQFSSYILKEHKSLHRIMGRIYVFNILFINFPPGMLMAFYANGGWTTQLAFIILDSLWLGFTLKAYLAIRKRDLLSHKEFMIRSYALTFSAITLRMWRSVLAALIIINPDTLYKIDAWLGFVPNLLFAEWLIWRKRKKKIVRYPETNDG